MRPTRYALTLFVDPKTPRFKGAADIVVELQEPRDVLWLHGRDLSVSRATVKPAAGPEIEARWEQRTANGVAALHLPRAIGPGPATIHLEWNAAYGKSDQALNVVTRGGDAYAFSQFEALDARRTFPCFDEPGWKTPYDVTLVVPRGLQALSNAREVSRKPADDPAWERVTFAPTAPLPSYLVAFAVGPLDIVSAPSLPPSSLRDHALAIRAAATRGRGKELGYTLAHTGEIVSFLEGYFGIAYPFDKLDLVAVPEKNGAMENAGALMFAESLLLLDEAPASLESRFNFAAYVGHEIAHQWFGDLVTMGFWDDLWLNEAFATWMEPRILAAVRPDLHPEVHALEAVHRAMDADSLASARAIREPIKDDNDVDSAFDPITYEKGAAVIGMFERWIGAPAFQRGIQSYLAAHRYGTASADDLLQALSAAAGKDVAPAFHTFLDRPGLPLVDAKLVCDGKPRLELQERRVLPLGSREERRAASWQVPVCARYGDGKDVREACALLTPEPASIPLGSSCPAWVMPNAGATGYYLFALDAEARRKLALALPSLAERERMSFAKSLTASFDAHDADFPDLIEVLAPLAADSSAAVTSAPMYVLTRVASWLDDGPAKKSLEAYGRELFDRSWKSLGWDGVKSEDAGRVALRAGVIQFLAFTAREPAVRREALARARSYLGLDHGKRRPEVPAELLGAVLRVGAEDGGAVVFDALIARLATEESDTTRRSLLVAIGSAADPALAARAEKLELDPRVHPNETGRILEAQIKRRETRDAAWDFLKAHVDALVARMPPAFSTSILSVAEPFCDARHKTELTELFGAKAASLEGGPRALAAARDQLDLCIWQRASHDAPARAFFEARAATPKKKAPR